MTDETKAFLLIAPKKLFDEIDAVVKELDTDRSKFIRQAIKAKLYTVSTLPHPEGAQPVPSLDIREVSK